MNSDSQSKKPIIVSIEGNIGSGKSTLVNHLENDNVNNPKICFLQEPVDVWDTIVDKNGKTILANYYENQQKYSFSFQMMAYISRLSSLKKAIKQGYDIIICERCVLTDRMVFAKMLYDDNKMEEIEYTIYLKWFDEFIEDIPKVNIVYVKTIPIIVKERVDNRARCGEDIQLEYLINCDKYHNDWLDNVDGQMIVLDGNINIIIHPEHLVNMINDVNTFTNNLYVGLNHKGKFTLQFDGGSRGNPGLCGSGFVILNNVNSLSKKLIPVITGKDIVSEHNTNNYAEYMALIMGLEKALNINIKTINIQGDSLLIINQAQNTFACNSTNLRPLKEQVQKLLLQFDNYSINHIPRKDNAIADALANEAMDKYIKK